MSTMMFVNLPVEDLTASRAFYAALGYTFDENFSGEQNATVRISDTLFVVLLSRPYFATYITTEVADAHTATETMLGLTAETREGVDELVDRALAAGGRFARDTHDYGFMYTRSFLDPDGHFWEVFWMDPAAAQDGPPERFTAAGERIDA
ncbi:MAG TPA: VOC family protein [Diaminobutyricibacter sp.]